jgi:hypothetical protein
MDATREQAYRLLLSAGLLHVKWDLACLYGGFSWLPWQFLHQARSARRAAHRAATFHNLAIFAAQDFRGFSEDWFWGEVERFSRDFPESGWSNYRGMFEAALRGEEVHVIQPGGGVPDA